MTPPDKPNQKPSTGARSQTPDPEAVSSSAASSARSTIGGPAGPAASTEGRDPLTDKFADAGATAAGMPNNPTKPAEYGEEATEPPPGITVKPPSFKTTGSTLSEDESTEKTGGAGASTGTNPTNGPLDRVRVDSGGRALTTNQGVQVADNQSSLKAGLRGPALLEDFILREKITHFDHERIPERIVHARGSGAHGYFECYEPLTDLTRASLFATAGKKTPVFVRFSTVVGERGSADTARDVRGFAVKFYTDEGNWDLVGNNIPVFFIQDAMKFPDLVHAAKPEPHFGMPQAATAHDTFWDFVSLMPESTHMLMWTMSDRAIPRSYRMMQGFGVHTFRLVNADGESRFVKFHWRPLAGTHSLAWDEAVKISGADPDFHRRDLWEAIEGGAYPEYELAFQVFTEAEADTFSFDVLDATKLIPEELVPLRPVGRMVLNRNPDNFFAETEQVAFCTAHIVPGLDFSNDPLLAGRIHSYVDTQISRLGGPNFHEIPINSPVAQVHNNQRDGMHRQAIARGRVSYEPNSLGGGCPFQAGMTSGFTSFRHPIEADKVRGKPELFADHYTQATLFWQSQTDIERAHITKAFRFELTRVQTPAIRERVVAMLANVATKLADDVAEGLGIAVPPPLPKAMEPVRASEVKKSSGLSLTARPGEIGIKTRRIAILIAPGVDGAAAMAIHSRLLDEGAVPRLVGVNLGPVKSADRLMLPVEVSLEAMPSVLFDAVALPGGEKAMVTLSQLVPAVDFLKEQYRHAKAILAVGDCQSLLKKADIPLALPSGKVDPGIVAEPAENLEAGLTAFISAVAAHRHWERESDPPRL